MSCHLLPSRADFAVGLKSVQEGPLNPLTETLSVLQTSQICFMAENHLLFYKHVNNGDYIENTTVTNKMACM